MPYLHRNMGQGTLTTLIICVCAVMSRAADIGYMRTSIQEHLSQIRHHTAGAEYKTAAKEFIHDEFIRLGLETEYHNFDDTQLSQKPFTNVVGIIKGSNFGKASDRILGVGAHYDTVAVSPGVDDNGAGVAAMLDVARQLTKDGVKRKNTILIVSFDLEELGYVGSDVFISQWLLPWIQRNYNGDPNPYGIIVLDSMMEYNTSAGSQKFPVPAAAMKQVFPETVPRIEADHAKGDFLALIYRKPSAVNDTYLAAAVKQQWACADRPEMELEEFPLPFATVQDINTNHLDDFLRSDHRNFWENNIPAVYVTDTGNFRGDMENCYHHACDDVVVMLTDDNLRFLGKIADVIAKTVNMLSEPTDVSGAASISPTCLTVIMSSLVAMLAYVRVE